MAPVLFYHPMQFFCQQWVGCLAELLHFLLSLPGLEVNKSLLRSFFWQQISLSQSYSSGDFLHASIIY